jgi:hypothetical protein
VTPWKDLYFPKGCGGPGSGTEAASGPGGVIGGHPGTPGTPRALLKWQSSIFYTHSNTHISNSYLSSVFLFHEIKSVVSNLFILLATGPRMTQSVIGQLKRQCSFDPKPLHMGFVLNKAAMGQFSFPELWLSVASFIPPVLHYHIALV